MLFDDPEEVLASFLEGWNAYFLSKIREGAPIRRVTRLEFRKELALLNVGSSVLKWSVHSSPLRRFLRENDSEIN